MGSQRAIIFGTGSFAELVYFYLTHDSTYEVVAFTAHRDSIGEDTLFDKPVVAFEQIVDQYPPSQHDMFIAVGYSDVNKLRERIYHQAKEKGFRLLTYISSKATVWTTDIGDNCFVMEDNTVQPYVKLGNNVILWSGNHIGHHSVIEDHCFLASHVVVSGHCRIKERTFVGVNATLRDAITIERDNVIGAGALVLRNTKPEQVFAMKSTAVFPKSSSQLRKI